MEVKLQVIIIPKKLLSPASLVKLEIARCDAAIKEGGQHALVPLPNNLGYAPAKDRLNILNASVAAPTIMDQDRSASANTVKVQAVPPPISTDPTGPTPTIVAAQPAAGNVTGLLQECSQYLTVLKGAEERLKKGATEDHREAARYLTNLLYNILAAPNESGNRDEKASLNLAKNIAMFSSRTRYYAGILGGEFAPLKSAAVEILENSRKYLAEKHRVWFVAPQLMTTPLDRTFHFCEGFIGRAVPDENAVVHSVIQVGFIQDNQVLTPAVVLSMERKV